MLERNIERNSGKVLFGVSFVGRSCLQEFIDTLEQCIDGRYSTRPDYQIKGE